MKRAIAWLLLLALCLYAPGCAGGPPAQEAPGNTVVDGTGAALIIPENNTETTIASVYAVAVPFFVALGLSDRVLAVNVKSTFWTQADEALAKAGSVGRGAVDMEALAKFAPGVLVHRSNDMKTVDAVKGKLNIETLCITVEDIDDIRYTLTMMGEYFGVQERAKEAIAYLDSKFEMINEIVRDIPVEARKTALVMGGELGRVAGGDMLQSWMIEQAGGVSVTKDISENRSWTNVGVEMVFDWNPAYIFCTSSTVLDYRVDDLLEDPVWSAVAAVKDKQVFVMPAKIDSWDMPGLSCAIGAMYMLHKMHPDMFSAEQLEQEIDAYYEFMFHKTFEPSYLGYALGE